MSKRDRRRRKRKKEQEERKRIHEFAQELAACPDERARVELCDRVKREREGANP